MSYKEAYQVAKETDKALTCSTFDPSNLVFIHHEDGAQLIYRSAFLMEWKNYVFVFTEHHSFHVYDKDDLFGYGQYAETKVEKLKETNYRDKCQVCNLEFKVEDLMYNPTRFLEPKIICEKCYQGT